MPLFHKFKVGDPTLESIVKARGKLRGAGKTGRDKKKKYTHGQVERRQRDSSVKENHKVVMNQRRLDTA